VIDFVTGVTKTKKVKKCHYIFGISNPRYCTSKGINIVNNIFGFYYYRTNIFETFGNIYQIYPFFSMLECKFQRILGPI